MKFPPCCFQTTEQVSRRPRLLRVAVCILEGPLLMLGAGWRRGGGRVGRGTPLDQYSTHTASAGGRLQGTASRAKGERWRPREDHTGIEASTSNYSSLFSNIYLPLSLF